MLKTAETQTVDDVTEFLNLEPIKYLYKAWKKGQFKEDSYSFEMIACQGYWLSLNDGRQMRWEKFPKVYSFCECMLSRLGKYIVINLPYLGERDYENIFRGMIFTGAFKNNTNGNFLINCYYVNYVAPCSRIIRMNMTPIKAYLGVAMDDIERLLHKIKLLKITSKLVIQVDATDMIRKLSISRKLGLVFGLHGKILKINEVDSVDWEKVLNDPKLSDLSTKVFFI